MTLSSMKGVRVTNRTRNTVLATHLAVANSGEARRKGLLGKTQMNCGEGLWIIPCECIHTFFMRFPIDVIYVDRKLRVKKLTPDLVPWRLSGCLMAHSVLELPVGTINASCTELGDKLELAPVSFDSASAAFTP